MTATSPGRSLATSFFVSRPTRAVPVMLLGGAIAIAGAYGFAHRLSGAEQLASMTVGGLVGAVGAQHADDLGDQRVSVDPLDDRGRLAPHDALLDPEVGLSQ